MSRESVANGKRCLVSLKSYTEGEPSEEGEQQFNGNEWNGGHFAYTVER